LGGKADVQPGCWKCVRCYRGKAYALEPRRPERHTKKANDPKRQRMWAEVANSVLSDTGDEGRAIREANSTVAKDFAKSVRPGHSTSSMLKVTATNCLMLVAGLDWKELSRKN